MGRFAKDRRARLHAALDAIMDRARAQDVSADLLQKLKAHEASARKIGSIAEANAFLAKIKALEPVSSTSSARPEGRYLYLDYVKRGSGRGSKVDALAKKDLANASKAKLITLVRQRGGYLQDLGPRLSAVPDSSLILWLVDHGYTPR